MVLCGTNNRIARANALLESGRFREARTLYQRALEREPDSYAAHYGLGMCWCAEAIHKTELALAQPGDWYPAIYHMTNAANRGAGEPARKTLAILHFNLGAAYRKEDRAEAAIARLEQALAYDSALTKANNLLGAMYHQYGNLKQAQKLYQRVIILEPDYAPGYFNLGAVAWARKDFAAARDYFNEAVRLAPQNPAFGEWLEKARRLCAAP